MKLKPSRVVLTLDGFLRDRQGRTFADVVNDPELPFERILDFFSDEARQRRMVESEIHHDRPPLAGAVRELESLPEVDQFLSGKHARRSKRLRQAIGVVVRMVMEQLGWKKTGKKGSLGVRAVASSRTVASGPHHNTGGLAFWFLRAERYELQEGMPFLSVRERTQKRTRRSPRRSNSAN